MTSSSNIDEKEKISIEENKVEVLISNIRETPRHWNKKFPFVPLFQRGIQGDFSVFSVSVRDSWTGTDGFV